MRPWIVIAIFCHVVLAAVDATARAKHHALRRDADEGPGQFRSLKEVVIGAARSMAEMGYRTSVTRGRWSGGIPVNQRARRSRIIVGSRKSVPAGAIVLEQPLPEGHKCLSGVSGKALHKMVAVDAKCSKEGAVESRRVYMAVHQQGDIVSNNIAAHGYWELDETIRMEEALATGAKARGAVNGVLMDIGANIGWYTLFMAACGHDVVAVEPLKQNAELIQLSLCANGLEDKVKLINRALGVKDQSCALVSGADNRGDAHTVCSMELLGTFISNPTIDYVVRSMMNLRRLDDILEEVVPGWVYDVMKIDVEGFELPSLTGGHRFLSDPKNSPSVIFSEFDPRMTIGAGHSPAEYLNMLRGHGYKICWLDSDEDFTGPGRPRKGTEVPSGADLDDLIQYSTTHDVGTNWDVVAIKPLSVDDNSGALCA